MFSFTMHKYYVSLCEIEYVKEQQSLQITLGVTLEDLEFTLNNNSGKQLNLASKIEIKNGNPNFHGALKMAEYYLYMIRTRRGALYTGITTDVDRRFAEHQAGGPKAARYLRGRMLSAQLRRELRERFDDDWYRNPQAGPFLGDWFAHGLRFSAADLAATLGTDQLGADAVIATVRESFE